MISLNLYYIVSGLFDSKFVLFQLKMSTMDSHDTGTEASDTPDLSESYKDLCGETGCSALIQDDCHKFCTSHSTCTGNGEYNPEVCDMCWSWITELRVLPVESRGTSSVWKDRIHHRYSLCLKSASYHGGRMSC